MKLLAPAFAAAVLAWPACAATDLAVINRINTEAYNRSSVAETAAHLTDRIGSRLANSPGARQAEAWTQERFKSWGLVNVRKEGFPFGRGWQSEFVRVRMTVPRPLDLRAIPVAWSPGTNGAVSGEVVVAPMRLERDLAAWKGKLAGKVVLVTAPAAPPDRLTPDFRRLADADVTRLDAYQPVDPDPRALDQAYARRIFAAKLDAFLAAEGAVAMVRMSPRENGLLQGTGSLYKVGATAKVPAVEVAAEDYRRLTRLAKGGPVRVELESRVRWDDSDPQAYNVIAEIPGGDLKAGYVMAGAHLDSWAAADGAADNAAGSAIVMEAARILASLGLKPKRTIRFALWGAEEEGLLGSNAYVAKHLATRPPPTNEKEEALEPGAAYLRYPITPLPGYGQLAGYFNLDNGSGRIRGIYAEGNAAAIPVLKEWLEPFAPHGAGAVVARNTGSTDHVPMRRIGLPAFQFVQDPLDYGSTVHHTSVDTFDHLRVDDMRQAAAVAAGVLWQAANAATPLPGLGLPSEPKVPNPYVERPPADQ